MILNKKLNNDFLLNEGIEPVGKKAERGLLDANAGFLELPGQPHKAIKQDSLKGVVMGICKAIAYGYGATGFGFLYHAGVCSLGRI